MKPPGLMEFVIAEVSRHVRSSRGYETESFVNPFTPVDSVSAFVLARTLTEQHEFDACVSVAPEGHVYGYFFQLFNAPIVSVHVDYPPRRCQTFEDLEAIRGKRVLILEDDVASGTTLRLVVQTLLEYQPRGIDLFLGRRKDSQILEAIHPSIDRVFMAEDFLDASLRAEHERQFAEYFKSRVTNQ